MRDVVAVVEPAVDVAKIAREIAALHVQWQDGERAVDAAEKRADGLRRQQQERRIEIGRKLIAAKSGIKHGGWLPYLERLGIEARTAQNWMREAGWVEESKNESPTNDSHLPVDTRKASGVDKRPRKVRAPAPDPETAPDAPDDESEPPMIRAWKNDIHRALVGLDKTIMSYAKSWPERSRLSLANSLRSIAERIESMGGD